MTTLLSWLWQLPQHLLAVVLLALPMLDSRIERTGRHNHTTVVRLLGVGWGVSLGNYILLDTRYPSKTVAHEYGHSRQSLMLGPLYLIAVGLPSITMNILTRLKVLKSENYYKRWPENWADRLGGVKR